MLYYRFRYTMDQISTRKSYPQHKSEMWVPQGWCLAVYFQHQITQHDLVFFLRSQVIKYILPQNKSQIRTKNIRKQTFKG